MWFSPDGTISKLIISEGEWGKKPFELSECEIKLNESSDDSFLHQYNNCVLIIGDSDNRLRRTLDICLGTMNENELAKFTIRWQDNTLTFTIHLVKLAFKGLIFQWTAAEKYKIALEHKNKGVDLFRMENRELDAAHRFTKGLKIICSIPINAQDPPKVIDDLSVEVIDKLKCNLYNNMASCYLKFGNWAMVVEFCKKALSLDPVNVKAHYKTGVALMKDCNFVMAKQEFSFVLNKEPKNTAALDQMKVVNEELRKADVQYNAIVKKMFVS